MLSSENWLGILESLLFAAGDEGLTLKQIAKVMELPEFEVEEMIQLLKMTMIIMKIVGYHLSKLPVHINWQPRRNMSFT